MTLLVAAVGVAGWAHRSEVLSHGEKAPQIGVAGGGATAPQARPEGPRDHQRLLEKLIASMISKPGEETGSEGESRFHQMIAGLKSGDFAALTEQLAAMQRRGDVVGGHDLQMKLLGAWAEMNPAEAATALSKLATEDQPDACRTLAATWTRNDPDEALAWARGLPAGDLRGEALTGIGHEEAFANPRRAIELAQEAGATPGAAEVIDQAVTTWAASDAQAAMTWGKEIAEPALREKVLAGVAVSWADRDPYAAANLVIDSVGEGQLEENSLVGIVQRIALGDMAGARDWVAQFPEGRMRERAEAELVRITERATRIAP
ncbi:MAG: hypothetical protein JWO82_1308, partial [Akkermansiaceae bacterium]|nr:hypothetical protein [Akkermansiaceae bacterium]